MPGDSWINEQGIRQDRADDDNVISRLAKIEGVPLQDVFRCQT
jgi:hypothetical protein